MKRLMLTVGTALLASLLACSGAALAGHHHKHKHHKHKHHKHPAGTGTGAPAGTTAPAKTATSLVLACVTCVPSQTQSSDPHDFGFHDCYTDVKLGGRLINDNGGTPIHITGSWAG